MNNVANPLTAAQLAAIAAVQAPLTVTQAAGNTNNGSASWSYSVPDSAFDFLADGEVLTLTYTATVDDGHGGVVTKPFTITVTGSNDAVVITSGAQTAAITEIAGAHGSDEADTASGSIKFADVDLTDTHAVTVAGSDGVRRDDRALPTATAQLGWLTLGDLTIPPTAHRLAGLDVLGPGSLFRLSCRRRDRHADLYGAGRRPPRRRSRRRTSSSP